MTTNSNGIGSKSIISGKLMIAVCEDKGGVGKSVICDLLHAGFSKDGRKVGLIDIDGSNSVGVAQHDDAIFADTSDEGWQGTVQKVLRKMAAPEGLDVLIFDSGARDEERVRDEMVSFAKTLDAAGGRLLVIRPLTTSIFTHENAADFAEIAVPREIAVVTMEVRAQGRTEKNFQRWHNGSDRTRALKAGAVESYVKNIGIELMDDAVACRLSIGDIANGNLSKPGASPRAPEFFNEDKIIWAQDIIDKQMDIWLPAFEEALQRRSRKEA